MATFLLSPGSARGRNGAWILPGLLQAVSGAKNQEMLLAFNIRHNLQGGQSPAAALDLQKFLLEPEELSQKCRE